MSTSSSVKVPTDVHFIKEKIESWGQTGNFDYVVHLAARPSPEDYIANPVSTMESNSVGTRKMLEIAKRDDAVFMNTSSSEVCGGASIHSTPETYYSYVNQNGIRSCYEESKRFSEALIMAYHRQYGLDTRIQRPFNVYGPRIRPDGQYGRVIPRFTGQALKDEPLTVHRNGKQTRSYLFVEDWVIATLKFLMKKDLSGTIMNIGSGLVP